MDAIKGSCECGTSQFTLSRLPTQRLKCHCTICQSVYDGPYSDFMLANAKTVTLADNHEIEFGKYKKPPALNRGLCKACQRPVMAFMGLLPGTKLAFIPAYTLAEAGNIPEASRHIWYQSRTADIDDNLPKYEGAFKSNVACLGPFYKGYRGR